MNNIFTASTRILLFLLCSGICLDGAEPGPASGNGADPAAEPSLKARLTHAFGDNAVLQQNMPVPVWGWSLPRAQVSVSFDKQTHDTVAGSDGAWKVSLAPLAADKLASVNEAPAGRTLTIVTRRDGEEATVTLRNILIGEVWLCSGQSNMAGPLRRAPYPPGTIEAADYPALRNLREQWDASTPEAAARFARLPFFFARELQRELLVPVGIITAATNGSSIESWLPAPLMAEDGHDPKAVASSQQAGNFKTRIVPVAGYAMRGAIWYQGESNVKDGRNYLPKMRSLIEGWRGLWGQGDFPFYFVQLAPIGQSPADQPAGGDGRAEIRQAQFEALAIPQTGMAVTMDIGDEKEHPLNKYDIALRLARWALHRNYGRADIVPSGPLYQSHQIEGSAIRVRFQYAQNGLMLAGKDGYNPPVPTPGAAMPWLSIQAKDGTWHLAEGKIDGSDLFVSNREIKDPVAVRYAYTNHPAGCNLYNTDGLPAAPFTTCGY